MSVFADKRIIPVIFALRIILAKYYLVMIIYKSKALENKYAACAVVIEYTDLFVICSYLTLL